MQETPSVQGGSGDGNEVPLLLGIIEGAVKAAQKTRGHSGDTLYPENCGVASD